ncbi:MAG TPA: serine/threonine-protein kinase [Kofleriaceae bacterium]
MSSTPAPKYVCPRCRSSFEDPCHFCRECGADMTRASALDAARVEPTSVTDGTEAVIDRRLNDSNQAWLGKVVDGRYKVMEVIGRGGMGVVYRVEHLRMGKVAAMKVLHRDLASDPDVVQRFEREAAAVSRLHHPHTVQVFDFGTAQGALYLIMEYVRGLDLGSIITRDGPLPWSRAAPLLAQICGALAEAHELGIVHRDLKPENVLITRTGNGRDYAKVLDFGLAKLEQQQAPTTATDRQQIVGTPYFMSPEQIRGDDVDARSDIYSFGCLMFEVLTGQHLFTGSTAVGVLTKHLTAEPDAPSMRAPKLGIDPQVDALCRKALAKEPSMRFQTATALVEAIEEVYTDTVGNATGAGSRSRNRAFAIPDQGEESDVRLRRSDIDAFERGMKRQRYVTLGLMIALVVGAAGGAAYVLTRPQPVLDEEREPNDDIAHANKIALTVTGHLGKRHSPEAGDRDTFIVPWPSTTKRVVSVRVSGLPNLDINLALTDGDGLHGAVADEGQIGEGEMLHRRSIDGSLVISIDQTLLPNQHLPVENVSDLYTVTVVEEDPSAGEVEPNGTDADANPLELTKELRGYLDTRTDVDVLRWMGETGTFNVVVRADGIPLAWHIGDNKPRTPGAASVQLQHGDVIRIERTDKGQKGSLPGRDQPWSIAVTK